MEIMKTPRGYEDIKRLAKELGCNVTDLLASDPNRDPFYSGGKSSREKAEWLAKIWEREGFESGTHLRRIHYRIVSREGAAKADGTPYKNDDSSWNYLSEAAEYARYLGLIDANDLSDRRNSAPSVYAAASEGQNPQYQIEVPSWENHFIDAGLHGEDWNTPAVYIEGYEYSKGMQPYHMEIWVEKTTMNDIFEPLCREFGANLVAGAGFLSITSVVGLFRRIEQTGKPCRIFYVSDFDPAGSFMPFSIARQIEYWKDMYSFEGDIKLKQVALTLEQVEKYQLPSIPIKSTDTRRETFQERYGRDATELDALEANYPGELERLLRRELEKYYDKELEYACEEARREAERAVEVWEEEKFGDIKAEIHELQEQVCRIFEDEFEERIKALQNEFNERCALIFERKEILQHAVINEVDSADIPGPPLPEPNVAGDGEDDLWIFDSSRDYLSQLEIYKRYRPKNRKKGKKER